MSRRRWASCLASTSVHTWTRTSSRPGWWGRPARRLPPWRNCSRSAPASAPSDRSRSRSRSLNGPYRPTPRHRRPRPVRHRRACHHPRSGLRCRRRARPPGSRRRQPPRRGRRRPRRVRRRNPHRRSPRDSSLASLSARRSPPPARRPPRLWRHPLHPARRPRSRPSRSPSTSSRPRQRRSGRWTPRWLRPLGRRLHQRERRTHRVPSDLAPPHRLRQRKHGQRHARAHSR